VVDTTAISTIHKSIQQHLYRFPEELRDSRKSKRMSPSHCLRLKCVWHTSQVPKGLQRRNGLDVEMPICASNVSKLTEVRMPKEKINIILTHGVVSHHLSVKQSALLRGTSAQPFIMLRNTVVCRRFK
jgi:hypothetical protein